MIIGGIHKRSDVDSRQALVNQFFDGKAFHLNFAGDPRVQIRLLLRQSTDHLQKFLPHRLL